MAWTPTAPTPPPVLEVPGWFAALILSGAGGIASAEAFGTPIVARSQGLSPAGIPSGEAFGDHVVRYLQVISPAGIFSLEAFGGSALQPGAARLLPMSIGSLEAVGTPAVSPGKAFVIPAGIASGLTFGTATISTGPVGISLTTGIASGEAFGTPSVKYMVSPTGIVSEETFGAHKLSYTITATGIPTAEAFGTPNVVGPPQAIVPTGIASSEAFGGSALQPGTVSILAQGIPGAEALGPPTITVGNVNVAPTGIGSAEAFGTATLGMFVTPTGIPSAESVGAAAVTSLYTIAPTEIASGEAFGTATLSVGPGVSVTYVSSAGNNATVTSITLPTHAVGDLILIFAYNGTGTMPARPAAGGTVPTWLDIDVGTSLNNNALRVCMAIATANNHTSGTWTNGSQFGVIVLRSAYAASPVGGHGVASTATDPSAPAVTMRTNDGTDQIIHFMGVRTAVTWPTVAGYTKRVDINPGLGTGLAIYTKNVTTTDGVLTFTTPTTGGTYNATVEVCAHA